MTLPGRSPRPSYSSTWILLSCLSRDVCDVISAVLHFLAVCRYVDQGGGKRKGAFAIYLEPWHADIFDWLELRKNHGKEEVCLNFPHSDAAVHLLGLAFLAL